MRVQYIHPERKTQHVILKILPLCSGATEKIKPRFVGVQALKNAENSRACVLSKISREGLSTKSIVSFLVCLYRRFASVIERRTSSTFTVPPLRDFGGGEERKGKPVQITHRAQTWLYAVIFWQFFFVHVIKFSFDL